MRLVKHLLEIKIDGLEKVKETLLASARKGHDMKPLMRRAAGIMHAAVEENFEQEGRPKWKTLSSRTIKQRTKKGHWPGRILQVSGGWSQVSSRTTTAKPLSSARIKDTPHSKELPIKTAYLTAPEGHLATLIETNAR